MGDVVQHVRQHRPREQGGGKENGNRRGKQPQRRAPPGRIPGSSGILRVSGSGSRSGPTVCRRDIKPFTVQRRIPGGLVGKPGRSLHAAVPSLGRAHARPAASARQAATVAE